MDVASKVRCRQRITALPVSAVDPASHSENALAVSVEALHDGILIVSRSRSDTKNSGFLDKKRDFQCAVMAPEAHATARDIIASASVGEVQNFTTRVWFRREAREGLIGKCGRQRMHHDETSLMVVSCYLAAVTVLLLTSLMRLRARPERAAIS